MISTIDKIIHLNDFSFIQLCDKNYGVNRGIYNTIDSWFYENGMENILERRRNIIFFLESIHKKKGNKEFAAKVWKRRFNFKTTRIFFLHWLL
jgi:riboflavin kinase